MAESVSFGDWVRLANGKDDKYLSVSSGSDDAYCPNRSRTGYSRFKFERP